MTILNHTVIIEDETEGGRSTGAQQLNAPLFKTDLVGQVFTLGTDDPYGDATLEPAMAIMRRLEGMEAELLFQDSQGRKHRINRARAIPTKYKDGSPKLVLSERIPAGDVQIRAASRALPPFIRSPAKLLQKRDLKKIKAEWNREDYAYFIDEFGEGVLFEHEMDNTNTTVPAMPAALAQAAIDRHLSRFKERFEPFGGIGGSAQQGYAAGLCFKSENHLVNFDLKMLLPDCMDSRARFDEESHLQRLHFRRYGRIV